jgi:hypothetical protein
LDTPRAGETWWEKDGEYFSFEKLNYFEEAAAAQQLWTVALWKK